MTNINESFNIDYLTKLYNRSYCLKHMDRLIKDNQEFSIFYMDLNKFSIVNDMYGHGVGDIVLKKVAKRFKTLENKDLLFARFGGDEFIGIYLSVNESKINDLGRKIHKVVEDNIIISESEFAISVSIGVARHPLDSRNVDDLLKFSDIAMYRSKSSNLVYDNLISEELTQKLKSRKNIEKDLKKLDVKKDLFLEYQPIFDLKTGSLTSVEALVRWNNKNKGVIYPNDFIELAEELDIIKDITRWVFITGLKQIKIWNEKYNTNYKLSLNVADACIHNKIFFNNVEDMLKTFKVKPGWVSIELSERSLSSSPEYMKRLLNSVNEVGIDIYLDSFGTYPIIISDLKEFNIKEIKIGEKFISNLDSEDGQSIVKAMILLANGLGIRTTAKQVEEKSQYDILKGLNIDKIQGFYYEKPMSKESLEEKFMKNKNTDS